MLEPPEKGTDVPSARVAGSLVEHLPGAHLPSLTFASTAGPVDLAELASGLLVLFVYPHATGLPRGPVQGWSLIPGARGCTAEARGFRDHDDRLSALAAVIAGLSAQTSEDQLAFAARMELRYPLISDPELRLATVLGLPTFTTGGLTFYRRLTLVARAGRIVKVFAPIPDPGRHASEILDWLETSIAGR